MYVAIRIRGLKGVRPEIRDTLVSLNLDRKNHCVLVDEKKPELKGMIEKARDYIAYGPVKTETLAAMVQKRGRLSGDVRLNPAFLTKHKMASYADAANALLEGKTTLNKLEVKPVFRLNAPRKGFPVVGTKKSAELKGPLGFHPNGVDFLLEKMM